MAHLGPRPIAVGVSQHGQIIKQPQHRAALAELGREQQQTFPKLLRGNVRLCLPGQNSSNQLRAITHRPDLKTQTDAGNRDKTPCLSKEEISLAWMS